MQIIWEEIYNNDDSDELTWWEATYRAKAIGGWIVKHEWGKRPHVGEEKDEYLEEMNLVFIPDLLHSWGKTSNAKGGKIND